MKNVKLSFYFASIYIFLVFSSVLCQTTAFIDVNVVPMDSNHVLNNWDVLIENDIITNMGPTNSIEIPGDVVLIDGSGKYLMPGLADMHVHFNWPEMIDLFIPNGITTIRNMWGDEEVLQWRDSIITHGLKAPTLYTAGPLIDGDPPLFIGSEVATTPDQGRQLVIEQKQLGYNFIKVYNMLLPSVYDAIIDEANNQDIPVIGHVPWAVGLEHALLSAQWSIEHFEGYNQAFGFPFPEIPIWENMDSSRLEEILDKTLLSGVWNCPTLTVYKNLVTSDEEYQQALADCSHLEVIPIWLQSFWNPVGKGWEIYGPHWRAIRELTFYNKLLKALHDKGARIILGTDTPNPFVIPGYSIHEELQLFVEAGLTPYEALKTGTYNAAQSLDALEEFGTVSIGKRADLVLLHNNPLDSIHYTQDNVGVMARGMWYPLITSLEKQNTLPIQLILYQNYPNPFNPLTMISYQLTMNSVVDLSIYNLLGQKVATLVSENQTVGTYKIQWDASAFASGVYVYRLATDNGYVSAKKLILLK